ncbi:MAG: hypothetical protein PHD48_03250 [Alphaproteobacteria bacterium]|nr:hypothetical protein [Alphaproteobacteria bacterium]
MIKKLVLGLIALITVIIVAVLVLGSNMDSIIKANIEKYGTEATKAATTLNKVQISLTSGMGTLEGFILSNPAGFKSDSAMRFNKVAIELDTKSVVGNGPIVIRKILIDAPELTYEVLKNGGSNLQTIQNNIKAYAASLTGPAPATKAPAEPTTAATSKDNERKLIVEHLTISNARVKLSHELLAGKNLVDAKIPTIELSNIGKNSAGVTAASLAQIILQKLSNKAMEIGQANLVNELRDQGLESLKGAVEQSGVGKAIGNIFGK